MKEFTTSEYYFSSSLLSYGFPLLGSESKNGTVYFKFGVIDEQLLERLNADFNSCNLYVNVKRFTKAQSEVRAEITKHK